MDLSFVIISDQNTRFVNGSFAYHHCNTLGKILTWMSLFPVCTIRIIVIVTTRVDVRVT